MAKPRVFISSTYYDLKHIRASLDIFVDSLGYEPVLSEKGDIAYTHDRALDESCYREAENADIFVLIVGGRYGSEATGADKKPSRTFFERYESITKKEYESAVSRDIPVYVLIEKGVNSEYQTFLRNKEKTDINYAHVESINVFHLIDDILLRPRNNPIQTFEKFDEIEIWLREQWAGLFRELLRRQSQQQQLSSLTTQVTDLKETNETLKKYLEAVMIGAGRQENSKLIESEEKRLEEAKRLERLRSNGLVRHLVTSYGIDFETVVKAIETCSNELTFGEILSGGDLGGQKYNAPVKLLQTFSAARRDLNMARSSLGLQPIEFSEVFSNDESSVIRSNKLESDFARSNQHVIKSEDIKKASSIVASSTKISAKKTLEKKGVVKKAPTKKVPVERVLSKRPTIANSKKDVISINKKATMTTAKSKR